mmetsp:Transcript_14524/g.39848  ORF Transcript_14524/g.39848 Transcript_14524/m.39848 type:complete len:251 (-) Transcript_14524:1374-2126(-)
MPWRLTRDQEHLPSSSRSVLKQLDDGLPRSSRESLLGQILSTEWFGEAFLGWRGWSTHSRDNAATRVDVLEQVDGSLLCHVIAFELHRSAVHAVPTRIRHEGSDRLGVSMTLLVETRFFHNDPFVKRVLLELFTFKSLGFTSFFFGIWMGCVLLILTLFCHGAVLQVTRAYVQVRSALVQHRTALRVASLHLRYQHFVDASSLDVISEERELVTNRVERLPHSRSALPESLANILRQLMVENHPKLPQQH